MMKFLIDAVKHTLGKVKVEELAALASKGGISVKDLIDLSFHRYDQIGFRSAWILERVYSNHQDSFLPYTKYFLEKFPQQQNLSALRHYVKILAFMTNKNTLPAIKLVLQQYDQDQLITMVFAWLIDEGIPVAIKSHCLNILANLAPQHRWIKDELIQTMDFLVDKESIAFFAKVKQIRKQLNRIT